MSASTPSTPAIRSRAPFRFVTAGLQASAARRRRARQTRASSIREIQEALAARRKNVPEGQWITSMGGWHPNQWAEHRHPTLKELDEAVPDRPVLLYERFTGPCATNSLGKRFFDQAD